MELYEKALYQYNSLPFYILEMQLYHLINNTRHGSKYSKLISPLISLGKFVMRRQIYIMVL